MSMGAPDLKAQPSAHLLALSLDLYLRVSRAFAPRTAIIGSCIQTLF